MEVDALQTKIELRSLYYDIYVGITLCLRCILFFFCLLWFSISIHFLSVIQFDITSNNSDYVFLKS
jgi:hypothetical protein